MKVGSITHNRSLSVESKGSKEKANFSDSFNLAHRSIKNKRRIRITNDRNKENWRKINCNKVLWRCYTI